MQITLWEHCASAAFSLNAFWGLLVTPAGHAVSPGVCPPSPVLVLSPPWEHKWQAAFKQAMLHLWNLPSRWFLMSCYCLISWGGGMAGAMHVVLDLQLFPALRSAGLLAWSCPWGDWRWAAAAGLCWGEELGQWGRAGELWCHKITSTPGRAQSLTLPQILPMELGQGVGSEIIWDLWVKNSWQELPELAGQNCWSQFGL